MFYEDGRVARNVPLDYGASLSDARAFLVRSQVLHLFLSALGAAGVLV